MTKTILFSAFVLGIILTVFVYQSFTIYELRTQVSNDEVTLNQIVTYLNQSIQQAQQSVNQGK